MHLGQLELGLGSCPRGEGGVSYDVAQSLPIVFRDKLSAKNENHIGDRTRSEGNAGGPLGLKLSESFSLGVVPNDVDVEEAADVELLGPELRHGERWASGAHYVCWVGCAEGVL